MPFKVHRDIKLKSFIKADIVSVSGNLKTIKMTNI